MPSADNPSLATTVGSALKLGGGIHGGNGALRKLPSPQAATANPETGRARESGGVLSVTGGRGRRGAPKEGAESPMDKGVLPTLGTGQIPGKAAATLGDSPAQAAPTPRPARAPGARPRPSPPATSGCARDRHSCRCCPPLRVRGGGPLSHRQLEGSRGSQQRAPCPATRMANVFN